MATAYVMQIDDAVDDLFDKLDWAPGTTHDARSHLRSKLYVTSQNYSFKWMRTIIAN